MLEFTYSLLFALALLSAVLVVFSTHTVYSALSLVMTMISIAGIFILINAQFAAVLQILVYAGAIMMLFLFVVMLLNLRQEDAPPAATRNVRRIAAVMLAALLVQGSMVVLKFAGNVKFDPEQAGTVTTREVSLVLLTKYLYAFEMTSIMLLVAVIGAMALARKQIHSSGSALKREG